MLWTTAFWKGASERAIKTFAQALAAYFIVGTTGLLEVDWLTALSVAGAASLASLLTSIGNAEFTAGDQAPGKHRDDDGDGDPDGDEERAGGGYWSGQ